MDHIFTAEVIMWARPPNEKTKKNEGSLCYYCLRVFNARFRAKFRTIENLKLEFGRQTDMLLFRMFKHWQQAAIDIMVQAGCHNVTVRWSPEEDVRELVLRQFREVRIEDAEDTVLPVDIYTARFGDWRTNGKGWHL